MHHFADIFKYQNYLKLTIEKKVSQITIYG